MQIKSQLINISSYLFIAACLTAGCDRSNGNKEADMPSSNQTSAFSKKGRKPGTLEQPIVSAAKSQIGRTTIYDPAYVRLEYPGGDVPIERGVCTDVVIRALRDALNLDLQKLLHEDMKQAFSQYPAIWGLKKPDRNIDHRRVPNLMTYFKRRKYSLPANLQPKDYLPGDLVTCKVEGLPHIMIVSDRKTTAGVPLVIHNIGSGTQEENRLFEFPITGHYRIKTEGTPEMRNGTNSIFSIP